MSVNICSFGPNRFVPSQVGSDDIRSRVSSQGLGFKLGFPERGGVSEEDSSVELGFLKKGWVGWQGGTDFKLVLGSRALVGVPN